MKLLGPTMKGMFLSIKQDHRSMSESLVCWVLSPGTRWEAGVLEEKGRTTWRTQGDRTEHCAFPRLLQRNKSCVRGFPKSNLLSTDSAPQTLLIHSQFLERNVPLYSITQCCVCFSWLLGSDKQGWYFGLDHNTTYCVMDLWPLIFDLNPKRLTDSPPLASLKTL